MTEIISLNKKRKEKQRAQKAVQATQNRIKHGRTKEEKRLEKLKAQLRDRHLKGHKRESEEE